MIVITVIIRLIVDQIWEVEDTVQNDSDSIANDQDGILYKHLGQIR